MAIGVVIPKGSTLIFVHIPEERWKLEKRRSMVPTEHRLEAYATLLSGVSSDLSKCFLRGVPRAHRYHSTVLV
jgi:hypothetical protein